MRCYCLPSRRSSSINGSLTLLVPERFKKVWWNVRMNTAKSNRLLQAQRATKTGAISYITWRIWNMDKGNVHAYLDLFDRVSGIIQRNDLLLYLRIFCDCHRTTPIRCGLTRERHDPGYSNLNEFVIDIP